MRRFALTIATFAILCVAAVGQAQAHGHYGYRGYCGYGYHGPVMVRPPVVIAPPVVVRVPPYRPVYRYNYYDLGPSYGFYYRGGGVSIGVGF